MTAAMAIAVFAMWPAAHNGFVWDDGGYVRNYPPAQDLSAAGVRKIFSEPHNGLYKPLTFLSFAINHRFGGLEPKSYHITNILLHACNAGLVFWLILLLVRDKWAAFLCAVLFGVHPMHVESVAWVTERKDMLYSLFFLLASIFYIKRVYGGSKWYYAASLACFGLSLLAKPMGITLPLLLFVYDYLLGLEFNRKAVVEKLSYICISTAFTAFTFYLLKNSGQIQTSFSLLDRILFVFYGLKFYIGKLLWPANLAALYPYPTQSGTALPAQYWLSPVTVLCGFGLLWHYFRHNRVVMGGLAFYGVSLLPVLQFFPSGVAVVADRYSYMASLGLFAPLSVYAARGIAALYATRKIAAKTIMAALAALVLILAFASRQRCEVWHGDSTLFLDAARKYPSAFSLNSFGITLLEAGRPDDALKVFSLAVSAAGPERDGKRPDDSAVYAMIGMARAQHRLGDTLAAQNTLENVYNRTGGNLPNVFLLALAEIKAGQGDTADALALLERARQDPKLEAEAMSQINKIRNRAADTPRAAPANPTQTKA